MFADDTALLYKGSNAHTTADIINEELHKVKKWVKQNSLEINLNKTVYLIFRSPQKPLKEPSIILFNNKA